VAAGEPEMKPALTHNPEQLPAMAAAPFLFVQGRLRQLGCGGTLRVRSVRGADGSCIQAVSPQLLQLGGRKMKANDTSESGRRA
jgi:hypothetical protein